LEVIFLYIFSFLLGSIPFAVVVGRIFYGVDVRRQGSGNPGATNTLRVLGKKAGISVLLLDIAKGVLAVIIGYKLSGFERMHNSISSPDIIPCVCGAMAVLGHVFSPFLKLKGGKGVATSIGVVLALQPYAGIIMIVTFILVLIFTKYVSLGSVLGALNYPVYNLVFVHPFSPILLLFSIGLATLILVRHKANIGRLIKGNESKFGKK
jgi:glycerol-3-phosphate acyltransferase PlsY